MFIYAAILTGSQNLTILLQTSQAKTPILYSKFVLPLLKFQITCNLVTGPRHNLQGELAPLVLRHHMHALRGEPRQSHCS